MYGGQRKNNRFWLKAESLKYKRTSLVQLKETHLHISGLFWRIPGGKIKSATVNVFKDNQAFLKQLF